MNIDVSNLLSSFTSAGELDNFSLSDGKEAGAAEGFSEAFLEQITLLQEQGKLPKNLEGLSALQEFVVSAEVEPLQEFAGLLNDYGKVSAPTEKAAEILPLTGRTDKKILHTDKEINIDETIDTLQDVMQHIASVTDFVEEKAAEVTDVISKVVDFLQSDGSQMDQQELPETNEQILAQPNLGQTELLDNDLENIFQESGENLISGLGNDAAGLESNSVTLNSQNESLVNANIAVANLTQESQLKSEGLDVVQDSDLAEIVGEQKNLQQVFAKDFEKASSVNSVLANTEDLITKDEQTIDAVSSFDQDSLDDMLNKEQRIAKTFTEHSLVDKTKEGQFDLNSLNGLSSADKSVTTYASDLALLNRQVVNNSNEMKSELSAMTKPFNHPEWQNEFNERIIWMNNKSISSAEVRLNPQHLGPVSIRLDVNQDQATIGFTAQHGAVREAIEAAIPKLREMLGGQQLNLAEVNVSQQDFSEHKSSQGFSQGEQKRNEQSNSDFSIADNDNEINGNVAELTDEIEKSRAVASNGLLNIYA